MLLAHTLIVLESERYNLNMLKDSANIAKNMGHSFEVEFYLSSKSKYTSYDLLNMHESRQLSKKLGALKFCVRTTRGERATVKKIIALARERKAGHMILSGVNRSSFIEKKLLAKKIPLTYLTLTYHIPANPFKGQAFRPGVQGYLVKEGNQYSCLMVCPSGKRHVAGLFYEKKQSKGDGMFLFLKNNLVEHIEVTAEGPGRLLK